MSGLVLKLRPRERLLINGVMIENGDKKARLCIKTEGADVLRLRDAITQEEATTPVRRAYFLAQQAVAGEIEKSRAADAVKAVLADHFAANGEDPLLDEILKRIEMHDFYRVMRLIGQLEKSESDFDAPYEAGRDMKDRLG